MKFQVVPKQSTVNLTKRFNELSALRAGKGKAANQKSNGARTAYRHGFRIRFVGSYLKTIDYLHALEALPWRFFWDAVEIDVKDHPEAEGSIVVYTLSLDRSWIDV